MEEKNYIAKFEKIHDKLHRLVQKYRALEGQVMYLENENTALRQEITAQNEELKNFQNLQKISKIASSVTVGEQEKNTGLKLKINEYIKEIDKCIAHLSD